MHTNSNKIPNLNELLIRHRWLWHLGFWGLYAISRAYLYYITVMFYERNYLEYMLASELSFVALVYGTLWLYKRLNRSRFLGAGLLLWVAYVVYVVSFHKYYLRDVPEVAELQWWNSFLNSITKYLITFALLMLAKYFKDNYIQEYHETQRKQLQLQSELQNLKAQIAPHFLFNTMNNFYGLAVERSEKLPELMVRLSDLLRYSLYDTKGSRVPLVREIAHLQDYIALEKIRLEDSLDFKFKSTVPASDTAEIAPLILIVFVENAFKHAKNVQNDPIRIQISISISEAGVLFFDIINNCLPLESKVDEPIQGIGLGNVRKRLEVLYPGELHELLIERDRDVFRVKLRINLQTAEV